MKHLPTGPEYWRSLEQLADSPALRERMQSEFPGYDPKELLTLSRRRFMKLMAASMALAGLTLTGCRRWPKEKLAPYTAHQPNRTPGMLEQYATVMELGGVGMGLLATSFDGRPIKMEGNPSHPFSKTAVSYGAADAYAQASVLELYDPDRSRYPVDRRGAEARASTWAAFGEFAAQHFGVVRSAQGAGFAVLSEASSGPSVADMRRRLRELFGQCAWYEYEPLNRDNELRGSKLAFGRALRPLLHLENASVVVVLDADILGSHPAHVRYAADWAARRRGADEGQMSRVYVAESSFSVTGAAADERRPMRASEIPALVRALAAKLGVSGVEAVEAGGGFVESAAADLKRAGRGGLVVAGAHLPPETHALVHRINDLLGAVNNTVEYVQEPEANRPTAVESIAALTEAIRAGRVQTLLILGGNPAYDAPADLEFGTALASVPMSIHLSLYNNETSLACKWHLPRAHYLESWSDARAWDGSISVVQPLILPLYDGKSIIEVLGLISGDPATDGEQIVRRTFQQILPAVDFEKHFRRVLHDGIVERSAYPRALEPAISGSVSATTRPAGAAGEGYEVRFLPSYALYDGRFANSGWLQELPDPLTKLTWDNAALMSVRDAEQLGITTGDVVRIGVGGREITIVAYVLPGQPQGVIGLPLGYGRGAAGNVGSGVGVDTYRLRTTQAMDLATGATVRKTGRRYELAQTQEHHLIDPTVKQTLKYRLGGEHHSGKIIREATFAEYLRDKHFVKHVEQHHGGHGKVSLQLYDPPASMGQPHRWGMAVDMNLCIGCGGCVVACQAENNIPVVGKEQVIREREMHWIRTDRYFKGDAGNPTVTYQAMMCVQCENAPCEEVCPVAATVHDSEGLNAQVYNRCIGTRYCSNNCPYKVRRFNYLDYHSTDPRGGPRAYMGIPDQQQTQQVDAVKRMVFNPDVTVRMRGVMEKCTYCVQRIRRVGTEQRNRNEPVRDGQIVTACQQACPTQAIVFGDLNDPESQVSKLHRNNRAYALLQEQIDTRPRTVHLAKLRNPSAGEGHG